MVAFTRKTLPDCSSPAMRRGRTVVCNLHQTVFGSATRPPDNTGVN